MFDGTVTSHTVNIDIFQETEDVDADSEFFYLNLTLPNFQQRQKRLSIQVGELEVNLPDDTMVTVRDVKREYLFSRTCQVPVEVQVASLNSATVARVYLYVVWHCKSDYMGSCFSVNAS